MQQRMYIKISRKPARKTYFFAYHGTTKYMFLVFDMKNIVRNK